MVLKKRVGSLELSFLPKAPDHGEPELAVVEGRRIFVLARGPEALSLWEGAEEKLSLLLHLLEEVKAQEEPWD